MRTKSFLIGFLAIVLTSILLIFFGDRPDFQILVSETHRQLKDNIENIKAQLEGKNEDKQLKADDKYLSLLGFGENARLYPSDIWTNSSLPVIVSYVREDTAEQGVGLARNIAHFLPNHTLILYNVGLSKYNIQLIQNHCNSSHCVLIEFDLELFPSHVSDNRIHAFRPLIIQDALSRAGAVLYLDPNQRITTSKISSLMSKSISGTGVLSWKLERAVTSLTHPRMFSYFKAELDSFIFLPMVGLARLLVYNTGVVHDKIMLPWVQCALMHECILPIGAQSGGCRFDKKPHYRYSGCHSYDISALNIVLGLHFQFDSDLYSMRSSDTKNVFREVEDKEAALELASLQENTTESSSVSVSQ